MFGIDGSKISLKRYANQLMENGEVHYIDLSSDSERFSGLKPDCHLYDDYDGLKSIIRYIKIDFLERLSLLEKEESLDNLPLVYVIVAFLPDGPIKDIMRNQLISFLGHNYRAAKYAFILNDINIELAENYSNDLL